MKFLIILPLLAVGVLSSPQGINDGRYVQDNSGAYHDGRYYHDNSGSYVHDNSGAYSHDNSGAYVHDGSGAYRGTYDPYRHQEGSQGGFGSGSGGQGGQGNSGLNGQDLSGQGTSKDYYQESSPLGPCSTGLLANKQFKILQLEEDTGSANYHYIYKTENKIEAEETGQLGRAAPANEDVIRANGYFQYVGPDCRVYRVDYRADENGFQPVGDHLPTPPPIPAAIQRALAYQGIVV